MIVTQSQLAISIRRVGYPQEANRWSLFLSKLNETREESSKEVLSKLGIVAPPAEEATWVAHSKCGVICNRRYNHLGNNRCSVAWALPLTKYR
jgi:hypothetical protein